MISTHLSVKIDQGVPVVPTCTLHITDSLQLAT